MLAPHSVGYGHVQMEFHSPDKPTDVDKGFDWKGWKTTGRGVGGRRGRFFLALLHNQCHMSLSPASSQQPWAAPHQPLNTHSYLSLGRSQAPSLCHSCVFNVITIANDFVLYLSLDDMLSRQKKTHFRPFASLFLLSSLFLFFKLKWQQD